MTTAWIISSGTELTLGQTTDSNGPWLARQLAAVGIRCTRLLIARDDLTDLAAALSEAARHADVIIMTGGLGPTADDLTRAAIAEASGDQLLTDVASLEQIAAFFAARGREMSPANAVQAQRPSRAVALPNAVGTAPGILAQVGACECYALPGVPHEMRLMYETHVAPRLNARQTGRVLRSRRLNTHGLTESEVGQRLREFMQRGREPEVGTTADMGIIGVRINAFGNDAGAADRTLDETESQIRGLLGDAVFGRGDETLATAVCAALVQRGERVAVAESCTGGLIGKMLTDVPGSSRCFAGGVIAYSNDVKQRLLGVSAELLRTDGAVSESVARAMAAGARERIGADYGLSVTGIAGPGGGSAGKPVGLVYVGLSWAAGVEARKLSVGEQPRDFIRTRAAHSALGWLRKHLLGT